MLVCRHPNPSKPGRDPLEPRGSPSLPQSGRHPRGQAMILGTPQGSEEPCGLPSEALWVPEQRVSAPSIPRKDRRSAFAHSS